MMNKLKPSECVAGKFYDHPRYGRVLCCGTGDAESWVPAFAIRDAKRRTLLKFFVDPEFQDFPEVESMLSECEQEWGERMNICMQEAIGEWIDNDKTMNDFFGEPKDGLAGGPEKASE